MPPEPLHPDLQNPPGQCTYPGCTRTAWIDGKGRCPRHFIDRVVFTDNDIPPPHDDDTQPGEAWAPPLWWPDDLDD